MRLFLSLNRFKMQAKVFFRVYLLNLFCMDIFHRKECSQIFFRDFNPFQKITLTISTMFIA